jgi:6-pyruvoyltetrahydropterin/6-carboxytetrahydropterin synthase
MSVKDVLDDAELRLRLFQEGKLRIPRLEYKREGFSHFEVFQNPADLMFNENIINQEKRKIDFKNLINRQIGRFKMLNLKKYLPIARTSALKSTEKVNKWIIHKDFSFCYGHRVWSQQLIGDYCEAGDTSCKCRHLHGHEGRIVAHVAANKLDRGMVTDFKHLGWLKNFLDDNIDHKFILDLNDPWFVNIINAEPIYENSAERSLFSQLRCLLPRQPLNTTDDEQLLVNRVYIPGTKVLAGYNIDTTKLSGPEQEFFASFFLVNFLPTSENLSKWLYDCVESKMTLIGIDVEMIEWWETPKSCSTYRKE